MAITTISLAQGKMLYMRKNNFEEEKNSEDMTECIHPFKSRRQFYFLHTVHHRYTGRRSLIWVGLYFPFHTG